MRSSPVLAVLLAIGLHPGDVPAQRPDTRSLQDLAVAGLPYTADSGDARRLLGSSDSVELPTEPDDEGVHEILWRYKNLLLAFRDTGNLYVVSWSAGTYVTAKGLGLDASAAEVRALCGEPESEDESHMLDALSTEDTENRGILFVLTEGRVSQVDIGVVIALE